MIAADHDRSRHRPRADELVDREPGAGAIAVAEPADPGGQPLERHPFRGQLEPALQQHVLGKQPPQLLVDRGDVGRIAGQGGPAKRSDAAAEERPDIGRDEARV